VAIKPLSRLKGLNVFLSAEFDQYMGIRNPSTTVQIIDISPLERKSQALRVQRSKVGFASSIALLLWLTGGHYLGMVSGPAILGSAIWIIGIWSAVFWLQYTNRNLKCKDPTFTQPLVFAAICCVLVNALFLDAASTNVVFTWVLISVGFATFGNSGKSIAQVTYISFLAIFAFGYIKHQIDPKQSLVIMIWQMSAFIGALVAIATYGAWAIKNKHKNRHQQLLADLTISSMTDAVLNLDAEGHIISANPAAERLFDTPKATLRNRTLDDILARILVTNVDDQATLLVQSCNALVEHAVVGRTTNLHNTVTLTKASFEVFTKLDGYKTKRRVEASLNPVKDKDNRTAGILLLVKDITEQSNLIAQLDFDSTHDSMTGLLNRRAFEAKLENLEISENPATKQYTVAILDLDNLKTVNDTCGHQAGDELIERATKCITRHVRSTDSVSRYGGDEFAVIFGHSTREEAQAICERIVLAIKELNFQWNGKHFKTGASMGCFTLSDDGFSKEACLAKADSALYLAKELGKGRVQFYDLELTAVNSD
jgi:diguanylate cyclase (GGDEF)-like protein